MQKITRSPERKSERIYESKIKGHGAENQMVHIHQTGVPKKTKENKGKVRK